LGIELVSWLTFKTVLLPIKMGLVLNEQVRLEGQAREMAPVKLVGPCAWRLKIVWVLPIFTGLPELGEVMVKAEPPIPVSATVCGLPVALSLKLNVPVRVPLAVGLKYTYTLQLCDTARVFARAVQELEPWELVTEKSRLEPIEIPEILNVSVPVLVMVTVWGALTVPTLWLTKERLLGWTVAAVAAVTPVPVREIVCSVPGTAPELSVMVILLVSLVVLLGVKLTYIVQ
jgi:hypothetical protein